MRVETFGGYIKPDCNIWDQRCIDNHQIHPDNKCIVSAHNIGHVWGQFKTWLNRNVGISETVIFVAWNGETCDLKMLWKITQAPWSRLSFPSQIKFFIDPYCVIPGFKLCPLHKLKSKLEGYDLGSMWKYTKSQNMNGAHNSLVDIKAQTDILLDKMFVGFINRTTSIQTMDAIFSTTQKNNWKKEMEPEQSVHSPWGEQTKENNFEWTPQEDDSYAGFVGGPLLGPTTYVQGIAMQTRDLASIFLAILPLTFFSKVVEPLNNYCFEDCGVENMALDSEDNPKKRPYSETVPTATNREPTPGHRHHADKQQVKWRITPGFIIC
jgi:hypothetical protein